MGWLRTFDVKMLTNNTYPCYLIIMGGVIVMLFMGSVLYDKMAKLITVPILNLVERFVAKYRI